MSEIKILDRSEMDRLKSIEEGYVPNPEQGIVIIAEENGEIIGRMMMLDMVHIEGTWVHPNHRGGTVGARLMKRLVKEAKDIGISKLVAYSDMMTDDYMARLGFKRQPFTIWTKEI